MIMTIDQFLATLYFHSSKLAHKCILCDEVTLCIYGGSRWELGIYVWFLTWDTGVNNWGLFSKDNKVSKMAAVIGSNWKFVMSTEIASALACPHNQPCENFLYCWLKRFRHIPNIGGAFLFPCICILPQSAMVETCEDQVATGRFSHLLKPALWAMPTSEMMLADTASAGNCRKDETSLMRFWPTDRQCADSASMLFGECIKIQPRGVNMFFTTPVCFLR